MLSSSQTCLTALEKRENLASRKVVSASLKKVKNLLSVPYSAANLCKRKYRPQLIISVIFMIFQQFDGINAIIVSLSSQLHSYEPPKALFTV